MAKNQSTYTLKIDAELGNLQKILNEAKTSLTSFMQSGNAPKGLEKAFEKIKDLLGQISDKTGKPLDLKGLTSTGKDLNTVQENFRAIIRLLGEFDDLSDDIKLSFLSTEEQKKVTAVTDALKAYGAAAEESAKKVKLLDTAQKNLAKDEANLGKAKKKVSGLEKDKNIKTAKLAGAEGKLAAAKGLENVNPKDVAKYEAEVARLRAELTNLDNDLTSANEELARAQTAYDTSAASVKKMEAEIKRASGASLKQLKEEAQKLGISLEGLNGRKAADQIDILTTRLEEFKKEAMNGANPAFNEIAKGCKTAEESVEKLEDDVKQATETVKEMDEVAAQRDAFEAKIKSFLGLQGAAQLMRAALRDAIQTITELDATMADMAVVTDLDISDYWDQLPQYTERANKLGLAIGDVYKADTLFYQQGLKTNEVVAISTETMKMASIAGLDTAEATDRMTAALRGFNMELNEASARKIADVYSELAAITAADVDEISTAMTKTASIASSAGMEFETTAAFLSQIIETTRESAETAGTAMKTVIARFQELKKSPDEIGEVDGEIVDANAIETALRSVGVSLRDAGGQFRELDDVFLELSGKWNTLDKNTQRYIATIAAGSRQQSRFIAMMSDYKRTTELVTAANNSAGASQEQFEKKAESLEFKINQLKNAWHEFTMGIMESDLVKFGVDILTKFLEIVNKATDGIDGFGGSITKIISVLGIFKLGSKIFAKFKQPIVQLFADIVKEAGIAGTESAKNYKENVEKEKNSQSDGENNGIVARIGKAGKGVKDLFGRNGSVKKSRQYLSDLRKVESKKSREQKVFDAELSKDLAIRGGASTEEIADAEKELDNARKSLKEYTDAEEDLKAKSAEAWSNIGNGISAAGEALTGVGVGISMIGGLMSSLGLEEAGSVISDIGQAITMVGGALSIIPPILTLISSHPIVAIIVGILAAVLALTVGIISAVKNSSLEAKLQRAAEATEEAKKAAEDAKEAYDKLLSDKNRYDELQTALGELTYGTKEWKQALVDANQQVLELLQTYPELAAYMGRGKDGQLIIQDQGWDKIIEAQSKAVKNSQALVASRTMNEWGLKQEAAEKDFDKKALGYVEQTDSEGHVYYVVNEKQSEALQKELQHYYLTQGKDLKENNELASSLARKYNTTTDALFQAQDALEANRKEIEDIGQEIENVARAQLTALASEKVLNSSYGEQTIDAFANSQNSQYYEDLVTKKANEIQQVDSDAESETNETFKQLAMEYEVTDEMTGNDKHDLEALYKAMTGVEDIPDKLEGNKEELRKAIAEIAVSNEQTQKMEDYVGRLEQLNSEQQNNIAGILSQAGTGMGIEFAESFFTTNENGEQVFNQDTLLAQAQQLGYKTLEDWAGALNKSVEDLTFEAEKNARATIRARTDSFNKLNLALGKTGNEIQKIGETAKLSAGQEEALAEKLVQVSNISGEEAANNVLGFLGGALDSVGDKADELSEYLGSMNWQDVVEWDKLKETLEVMGISWTTQIEQFVKNAKVAANAMKIVDFNALNEELKSVYDTLKGIKSGEQGREFEQEVYEQLIKANKNLSKDFIQMGDKYIYIGTSMGILTNALEKNTLALMGEAKQQLNGKTTMAKVASSMGEVEYAGKKLSMDDAFANWSKTELVAYLDAYQQSAYEAELAKGENGDANALTYLDTKGMGLSFVTDFLDYDKDQLVEIMQMIKTNRDNLPELEKETKKQLEEATILSYTFDNSGEQNAQKSQKLREEKDFAGAELYSKALLAQSAQSGLVAEEILSQYSKLLEDGITAEESEELKRLEESMSNSLNQVIKNQEANKALIDIQNRVAEAIYNTRQKEIDKLSEVNESIQSANGVLISKLQEQIDTERQQRENEETKESIENLHYQQAYLSMDTSGNNATSLMDLDKQIQDAEQNYQDSLVDQAIQNLSDANEKAAEQRERQIALLQAQLDYDKEYGNIMQEATRLTNEALDDVNNGKMFTDTEAGKLITTAENWATLPPEEYQESVTNAQQAAITAANLATATDVSSSGENISTNLGGSGEKDSISSIAEILEQSRDEKDIRKEAVNNITQAAKTLNGVSTRNGFQGIKKSAKYQEELTKYVNAGGSQEDFDQQIRDNLAIGGGLTQGSIDGVTVSNQDKNGKVYDEKHTTDKVKVTIDGNTYDAEFRNSNPGDTIGPASGQTWTDLTNIVGTQTPGDTWLAAYNGTIYMYRTATNGWHMLKEGTSEEFKNAYLNKLNAFETGGLADFTGPAWLDGTRSRPEYVLNAAQTERFFSLVDILEGIDKGDASKKSSGDNYFDINIQVDKLESDYDVEQVADKIRRMIYEDASYRNVNAVNLIR